MKYENIDLGVKKEINFNLEIARNFEGTSSVNKQVEVSLGISTIILVN